jgi:putative NADH-flavin reductase
MRLAIVGANGRSGQQLVLQALERGHAVTAVVRSTTWSAQAPARTVRGEATDVAFLSSAFAGQDVIVLALGLRLGSIAPWARPEVPDFLSRATPAIVQAARATGVKRVLAISASGAGDSYPLVPAVFRAFIAVTALKASYRELEAMEAALLASGLEVCLARPSGLTDGPRTGQVKVCTRLVGQATVSRADVAAYLLDQAALPGAPARTPMITVTGAG